METEVTTTDQATEQTLQQESQSDSNVDYKALYLDEVNNSKKLRKRSQDAETKVTDFTTAQETNKVKQMKEQEQFQELSEELQKKLDSTLPYKEKWEAHENTTRENLLAKLPKADRERLANEKLDTLEYIVSLQDKAEPQSSPKHAPGLSRNTDLGNNKPYAQMNYDEKKAHHARVLSEQGITQI